MIASFTVIYSRWNIFSFFHEEYSEARMMDEDVPHSSHPQKVKNNKKNKNAFRRISCSEHFLSVDGIHSTIATSWGFFG